MMIGHYLLSALAKFRKAPFTTAANVLTLALGLACFIAAWGIADWWRSSDGHHANADRTFVVGQRVTAAGAEPRPAEATSTPTLARFLATDFPQIEHVARVLSESEVSVTAGDNKTILNAALADPDFLRIFDFEFIEGDARSALDQPGAVVLTREAAVRLFGEAPALGRRILVAGAEEAVVTGVIAPVRQPSFMGSTPDEALQFDMLRHWASSGRGAQYDQIVNWTIFAAYTFVVLPESFDAAAFNAATPAFIDRHNPPEARGDADIEYVAFPVSELTVRSLNSLLFAGGGFDISIISALLTLGSLTLIVACVNYANLAAAQAASRAKEFGMRKTVGAARAHIVAQAWTEAAALTATAALVALGLLALGNPAARTWAGLDLLHFLSEGAEPIAALAALVLAVSALAALYPALVLSGVRPVDALRSGRVAGGPKAVARVLVGVQFASASFLLILIAVSQIQRDHLERTALSAREDPIVVLNDLMQLDVEYEVLEARLEGQPGIKSVSVVDKGPWNINGFQTLSLARTPEAAASPVTAYIKSVGYDYFETINLDLLAGRAFERERDTVPAPTYFFGDDPDRPLNLVIDHTYASRLGFATPEAAVGQTVYRVLQGGGVAQPVKIIGVIEADPTRLEAVNAGGQTLIGGNVYTFAPRAMFGGQLPLVRIDGANVAAAVASINAAWNDVAPTVAVDIRFLDQLFERSFRTYARVNDLFLFLGAAAFIIASVGLIGIAVHVTARRRREIGVRKTLGATTLRVLRMLLADFSKPVVIGNMIAWPFAWMAAQAYLQGFAVRGPLTPAPFIVSLILTLLIAWASVGGQAWKAARVKPALVLKAE